MNGRHCGCRELMMEERRHAAAGPEAPLHGALSDSYMEGTRTAAEERNQTWLNDVAGYCFITLKSQELWKSYFQSRQRRVCCLHLNPPPRWFSRTPSPPPQGSTPPSSAYWESFPGLLCTGNYPHWNLQTEISLYCFWEENLQMTVLCVVTIYFEGIYGLEFSGSCLTEDWKHVHKFIEAEIPHTVFRKGLNDSVAEGIFLRIQICKSINLSFIAFINHSYLAKKKNNNSINTDTTQEIITHARQYKLV